MLRPIGYMKMEHEGEIDEIDLRRIHVGEALLHRISS